MRVLLPVRTSRAFTLIEIVIAIFILMLLLMLAVPSFTGVLADRRLRRSLDSFNNLVHEAQQRSLAEHRAYLLVMGTKSVELRPEALIKGDDPKPVAEFPIGRGETVKLVLPAALTKDPPAEWIFWPTGTCEPAKVQYRGRDGTWTANYSALSAQPTLTTYAAR
jgi:type II secretory pathway pseudopilin PulG